MIRKRVATCLIALTALSGVTLLQSPASAAGSFDGTWSVVQNCPATHGGVSGYTWRYSVRIANGALSGRFAQAGVSGTLSLSGKVGADGQAILQAVGKTGDSDYSVGHVKPGSTVHYLIKAHFSGSSGEGERQQQRKCSFAFRKG